MRVAVVGAGAVGGLWAAKLTSAGTPVVLVEIAREIVEAVAREGLILESAGGTETFHPRITADPVEVGSLDVVFFFVKAHHTPAAAKLAQSLVGPTTTVVSLQNGWGNADVLAATYPAEQIVIGVTYNSATVLAPGRVAHTATGPTFVGPYSDSAPADRAAVIHRLLVEAGFEATRSPQIKTEIWKKLILNAATLPTAALTRLCARELGQPGPLLDLVDALAMEAVAVARAQGYAIDQQERVARINTALANGGAGKASMLQDVEAHRKTEIEVINGAVVGAAERVGIDVPLNRAMVALLGGLERGWQQ